MLEGKEADADELSHFLILSHFFGSITVGKNHRIKDFKFKACSIFDEAEYNLKKVQDHPSVCLVIISTYFWFV